MRILSVSIVVMVRATLLMACAAMVCLSGGEAAAQGRKATPQKTAPKKQAAEPAQPDGVGRPNISYNHDLVVFVAKGKPDACGPGCDTWLAIEGTIDAGAAQRLRKVFASLKGRKLPIYLSSPGGNGGQSIAMGRMLRERQALARVGRTIVAECTGSQTDAACLKLKRSGRELAGELTTQFAVCASGCPMVVVGATTREIAPEVPILVHSPRVIVPSNVRIPPEIRARVISLATARINGEIRRYFTQMGVDRGLMDAYLSVRYQDNRRLTREEMYRFKIDTRTNVVAAWRLQTTRRPTLYRYVAIRPRENEPFKAMNVVLACDKNGVELSIVPRAAEKLAGRNLQIVTGAGVLADFSRNDPFSRWSRSVSWEQLAALSEAPRTTVHELAEENPVAVFDVDLSGLQAQSEKFAALCRAQAEPRADVSTASPSDAAVHPASTESDTVD